MKGIVLLIITYCFLNMNNDLISQEKPGYNDLTKAEANVILKKGTERPFTGKFENFNGKGTYVCKQCGAALYYSDSKFDAKCGWPSFDDAIPGAVIRQPDIDGLRTEILCANCGAHLGHVFTGEGFTPKDTRYCVNSISMDFVPAHVEAGRYGTAIFAGGCFWGVEYFMQKEPGVISVTSGYTGGWVKNPTYQEVCTGKTGHAEAVKIIYDPNKTSYEKLLRLFLDIHDPTQADGQGPDIGNQYRSEIFYMNDSQKAVAEKDLKILQDKGYKTVTAVTKASEFYTAEDYHQDYYFKNGKLPYCHHFTQRF
jgi:peptide methionine sulfoxide reductase msrA/msrB